MRRPSVVVALAVASSAAGCALQGIPAHRDIETTFLPRPAATDPSTPSAAEHSMPSTTGHSMPSAHVDAAELPAQFKVATFNIHMEPGDKVAKAILADRELRDADLIMLQEVPRTDARCSAACAMGRALGMHALFAPAHSKGSTDYGVAILSKAPITSAQILELPWNDVHFNAGRRIALVATLEQAGRPITVYAVHLENRLTVADRRTQMRPILEHAARQQTPVIIAGDFNTNPFTWVSHWLPLPTGRNQSRKLEAFVRGYGLDTPVADSGATHRYIGMKLDGIYTRGFETKRFATAHARDVSDHMALWATVVAGRVATQDRGVATAPSPGVAATQGRGVAAPPSPGVAATQGRGVAAKSVAAP